MREAVNKLKNTGFFHIIFGNTITKMLSFLSSIIVVRLISQTEYAALSYMDNIYSYILLFSGLGLSSALLKFCAGAEKAESKTYFGFALKTGLAFNIIVAVIIYFMVDLFPIPFSKAVFFIKAMVFFPALNYVLQTMQAYMRAKLQNELFALTGIVQVAGVLIFTLIFIQINKSAGIIGARYVAIIVTILVALSYFTKEFYNVEKRSIDKKQKKELFNLGISMMTANLFSTIIPINEMFLVNNILKDEIISANYKVATLIPSQLLFITNSIVMYSFPLIVKMQSRKRVWKYSLKMGALTAGGIGIVCVIGMVCTPVIIHGVYGAEYISALPISRVFYLVYFLNAGFRMIPMNILPAVGMARFNAVVSVITCITHFIIDYIMIKMWGLSGIVFGTVLVYLCSGIVYWCYLYRFCAKEPPVLKNIEIGSKM